MHCFKIKFLYTYNLSQTRDSISKITFFQLHTGDFRQYMIRTPYKIPKICVQVALLFEWWNVIAALNKKNKKWGNYMYM